MLNLEQIRVLLVDDSPAVIKLTRKILQKSTTTKYIMQACTSLAEAQKLLEQEYFDVILLDLNLTDSYGITSFYELHSKFGEIPIIILTSTVDEKLAAEALKMGAQDFLNKGKIDPFLLYKTINYSVERFKYFVDKKKLSLIAAKTYNNILILNRTGHIQWVNKAFVNNYGYTFEEVKGTRGEMLRKLLPAWLKDETVLEQSIEHQKSMTYELKNYPKFGGFFWSAVTISPVFHEHNGQFAYFIVVESDITERVLAERKLRRARHAAEQARKAEEEFIENISHEIRTPLNGIIGFANLLQESTPLTESQKEDIERIIYSSGFLLDIIGDVLDFSKIAKGKLELDTTWFNFSKFFNGVCDIQQMNPNKKKDVQCVFSNKVNTNLLILSDTLRIKQILVNLINNAFKFTRNGSITVKAEMIYQKAENVNMLILTVKDTGIGIDAKKQQTIFNKFSQEDKSITRKYGGTGLGLSIVKQLVQHMQGEIYLESEKGKGSTFTVHLPVQFKQEKAIQQSTSKTQKSDKSISNKKLLIAEDNRINQKLIQKLIDKWNLSHTIVSNGQEAVEVSKKEIYDLILMDIQMPVMDGYSATSQIRMINDHYKNIPILALTASASSEQKTKCIRAGMNDCVTKPFKQDELYQNIVKLLTT